MAIDIKHPFVSAKVDTLDTSKVQPSNWNATHTILLAGGVVVGRAAGAGQAAATEIPMGATGQAVLAAATQVAAQTAMGADGTQAAILAAPTKATPVDADILPLLDSAAGNALKKFTWANLKTTLIGLFAQGSGFVLNWAGLGGQPTWLLGGNAANAINLYNPSNFNVNAVGGWTQATISAQIESRAQAWAFQYTAAQTAGGVGSYALMLRTGGTAQYNPNDVIAGSSLTYTNVGATNTGITAGGSWRCMGFVGSGSTSSGAVTVWLRYA